MGTRRELTVVVDLTKDLWGDTLEEIAEALREEYRHPGAAVTDATFPPAGEPFLATLTEYDDNNGDIRTTTLWSTLAGDRPGTDTRTCASCNHLRVEHKHHGIPALPETWGRGWCGCCDCPAFVPEPDDDATEHSAPAPFGSGGLMDEAGAGT